MADIGGHETHWQAETQSTPNQMFVDVPKENGSKWARVEVTFRPLPYSGWWRFVGGSLFPLIAFVSAGWAIVTVFYLRMVFRRVDMAQARVVPDRVKNTLDTLAEGIVVLDRKGFIALANEAFARSVGSSPEKLRGRPVSELAWHGGTVELSPDQYPWVKVLRYAAPQTGGFSP